MAMLSRAEEGVHRQSYYRNAHFDAFCAEDFPTREDKPAKSLRLIAERGPQGNHKNLNAVLICVRGEINFPLLVDNNYSARMSV